MSTTHPPPPDNDDESTPLDVLLTAISGSTVNYPYPPTSPASVSFSPDRLSTVQLWYPTTAQKSYGKERRMLNPPPTLRVQGPLRDTLTNVTLVAKTAQSAASTTTGVSSSQTHRIPLQPRTDDSTMQDPPNKKAKRDHAKRKLLESAAEAGLGASLPWHRHRKIARARGALADGLPFPGLWAGEGLGKSKQFELELQIGQPGEDPPHEEPTSEADVQQPGLTADMNIAPPPALEQDGAMDPEQSAPDSPFPPGLTAADLEDIGGSSNDFMTTFEQHLNDSALADHSGLERADDAVPGQGMSDITDRSKPALAEAPATIDANLPALRPEPGPPRRAHRSLAYKHLPRATENPSPWATFTSSPLTIVSKPSIKTAKARSMTSCLTSIETFAMYVRINNQTTRTKYMKLQDGDVPQMTSRTGKWSPFRFEVIHREPIANKTDADMERLRQLGSRYDDVLTYGSVVALVDANTGIKSEHVRLTKIDKGIAVVDNDNGHPISELHRVAFVRVGMGEDLGSGLSARQYLSAPGARIGGGETLEPKQESVPSIPLPAEPPATSSMPADIPDHSAIGLPQTLGDISSVFADPATQGGDLDGSPHPTPSQEVVQVQHDRKRKTPRTALAKAAVAESEDSGLTALAWHTATRGVQEIQETVARKIVRRLATVETVEDWMCWTIVSVDSLSYSFFNGSTSGTDVPAEALKAIPRLLVEPKYRSKHNAIDLVISPPATDSPFDVYMGTIGPLSISLWKSSASSDMAKSGIEAPAILLDGNRSKSLARQVTSSFPGLIPHILVAVELPRIDEVLRLADVATKAEFGQSTDNTGGRDPATASLAGHLDQPEIAFAPQKDASEGHEIVSAVQASITDMIASGQSDEDHESIANPFSTTETSALADANAVWDGKLDLEIDSAFDGPETAFDAEPSTLMGDGVGIEKIGAALEALSGVPESFDSGENVTALASHTEPVSAQGPPPTGTGSDTALKLERPLLQERATTKGLPLYLVRRADGVGFGLAYSISVMPGSTSGEKEVQIVRDR